MTNSHLLILMQETKMSPEVLAKHMGVSNMTIRRLLEMPPNTKLSKLYSHALVNVVYEFIGRGLICAESALTPVVLKEQMPSYFDAAATNLNIPKDLNPFEKNVNEERFVFWLSEMGVDSKKNTEVDRSVPKIEKFKEWGKEWSFRISVLLKTIRSNKISLPKKLVAYGALFYLICPFDLIPDNIPVIGYMDDFLILGIAVSYILSNVEKTQAKKPIRIAF